jgi:hypothetical protein
MSEEQQIEEILEEANAYGLREEVLEMAEKIIGLYGGMMDRVSVYNFAYSSLTRDK